MKERDKSMEQQTMGKRIMQLRKEKGYTQEQLAEMMGVSAQAVSKWENDVSCPDISILPMLAEKLGVTTDELLGVKPIEPKVVIVDAQKTNKENDGSFSVSWDGGKSAKKDGIWFAVLVIVLGLAFLVQRLGFVSFGIWSIVWPAVIIGLGVSWMIKRFSFFAVAVAGLGVYFLLFNLGVISLVLTWSIIWPSLLVLLGLTILYETLIPHKHKCGVNFSGDKNKRSSYQEENGFVSYDCEFSDENRKVSVEEFMGGDIDLSFGKSELDLTSVKRVTTNAKLNVDVSFGTFDLIVPKTIRLYLKSDKSFGSIQINGEPNPDATQTLQVDGDVSFGTMNVFYR